MSDTQTAEELSVTFEDVEGPLTLPVLRDRVEEIVQENLVYNDVFRDFDATNIASSVVQIPVPKDDIGSPKVVDEGGEFPRSHEDYELEELTFDKFGFEVPLTREAVRDSRIDLVDDQVDRQAREMAEDMNRRAFEAIDSALTSTVSDNADGTMTYNDILEGRKQLVSSSYSPDLLIADSDAVHDLMKSDNFLRATDIGDQLRRDGAIGRIAGMEVVEDDSGLDLTGGGGPGALMVDTDHFGYEGEREPVMTEQYEERRTQTEVYRIWTEQGWLVIDDSSGVIVEG